MRRPARRGKKGKRQPEGEPPGGGRAFERIRQDRLARGLDAPSRPEALVLEEDEKPKPRRRFASRKR